LVIEQPGSWGARALRDASLPVGFGDAITAAAGAAGVGVLLARHPDRVRRHLTVPHHRPRIWVADVRPGTQRLHTGLVPELAEIANWDFAAIADGILPDLDGPSPEPLLLLCTQGGRDACCARLGRPVLTELLELVGPLERDQVWESSHIGGHRFAPTILALPSGAVHGRLTPTQARQLLSATASQQVLTMGLRGRTCLSPPVQLAEIAIRERTEESGLNDLEFAVWEQADEAAVVVVRGSNQACWTVRLRQHAMDAMRPESCGAQARIGTSWQVESISAG